MPLITTSDKYEPLNLITCGTNTSQPYCRKYSLNATSNEYILTAEFQNPPMLTLNRVFSESNIFPAFSGSKSDAVYFVSSASFSQDATINKQIIENSMLIKLVKTPKYALKSNIYTTFFT